MPKPKLKVWWCEGHGDYARAFAVVLAETSAEASCLAGERSARSGIVFNVEESDEMPLRPVPHASAAQVLRYGEYVE